MIKTERTQLSNGSSLEAERKSTSPGVVELRGCPRRRNTRNIRKEESLGRNRGFAFVVSARGYSIGGMQTFGQIPSARAEGQSPQVSSEPQTTDWMFLMRAVFGPLGCTDAGPDSPLSSPF